jgi:hypothetical protein
MGADMTARTLDLFARSLHTREVYRHRFGRDDTPGVDAYTTGGPSEAIAPLTPTTTGTSCSTRSGSPSAGRHRSTPPPGCCTRGPRPRRCHRHLQRLELTGPGEYR